MKSSPAVAMMPSVPGQSINSPSWSQSQLGLTKAQLDARATRATAAQVTQLPVRLSRTVRQAWAALATPRDVGPGPVAVALAVDGDQHGAGATVVGQADCVAGRDRLQCGDRDCSGLSRHLGKLLTSTCGWTESPPPGRNPGGGLFLSAAGARSRELSGVTGFGLLDGAEQLVAVPVRVFQKRPAVELACATVGRP